MDEVGRGCLFGPVFAGAVVLEAANASRLQQEGLTDSKRLSARRRGDLVPLIEYEAEAWGLGQASAREIDRLGIRPATELAMLRALQRLPNRPELVLVDGNLPLRPWMGPEMVRSRNSSVTSSREVGSVRTFARAMDLDIRIRIRQDRNRT